MEDKKLIFKTPRSYSYTQIFAVILFGILTMAWTTVSFMKFFSSGQKLPLALGIFGIWGLFFLSEVSAHWFQWGYTVIIDGNDIIYYNLFKKEKKLKMNEIVKAGKKKGFPNIGYNTLAFFDVKGDTLILPDIDFHGFICDYILLHAENLREIDEKWLAKLRNIPGWIYTRRKPFHTKYERGYLEWLIPVVKEQKGQLIVKGILRSDVFYGDPDYHKFFKDDDGSEVSRWEP